MLQKKVENKQSKTKKGDKSFLKSFFKFVSIVILSIFMIGAGIT